MGTQCLVRGAAQLRLMSRALNLHAKRASAHCSPGRLPAGSPRGCPVDWSLCTVYERKPEKLLLVVIFAPRVQKSLHSKKLVESTVKKIIQNLETRQKLTVVLAMPRGTCLAGHVEAPSALDIDTGLTYTDHGLGPSVQLDVNK